MTSRKTAKIANINVLEIDDKRHSLYEIRHENMKTYMANGLLFADKRLLKSSVPLPFPIIVLPGINFRVAGLGVSCTWINILRAATLITC